MPRLLPRHALIQTGPVDHADWNYRPVLGMIQRLRFQLICRLLPTGIHRLLEIGYGSGVFMPELTRRCVELHGIDIHSCSAEVTERLQEHGVAARLVCGSAESLPYEDASFDCVVAVSSLEFIPDIQLAAKEIQRVLKPTGYLVLATPGQSALLDLGLKLLTGESARTDYADRRERLMPALHKRFVIDCRRSAPPIVNRIACLYSGLRLKPIASNAKN